MGSRLISIVAAASVAAACTAPVTTATPTPTAGSTSPQPSAAAPTPSATGAASPIATGSGPGTVMRVLAIQRLDARNGFVGTDTGATPVFLRTQDGGTTWERSSAPGLITQFAFLDAQTGWVVARGEPNACRVRSTQCTSLVLTTSDGGRTWTHRLAVAEGDRSGDGPAIVDLAALDGKRAWITVRTDKCDPAGCAHEIRGTDDGGATWKVLRQPQTVSQIERSSASKGWALGPFAVARGGEILGTTDSGTTWTAQYRSELQPVLLTARSDRSAWALFFDPAQCTASACIGYDLVRTTDGAAWSSAGNPWKNVTNPTAGCGGHISQMAFGDEQTGWLAVNLGAGGVAGPGGVLRTSDGGRSWACQTTPPNTVLVSVASAQHIWVTSRDRISGAETVWTTEDGGQNWRQMTTLPPGSRSIDLCGRITDVSVGDLPSGGFITVDGVKYLVGTVDPTLNVRLPPLQQVVVGARACIRGEVEPVGTPPIPDVSRLRNAVVTTAAP